MRTTLIARADPDGTTGVSPPFWAATTRHPRPYRARVSEPDELMDDDAANRSDMRRATIITIIALATVVIASLLVVVRIPA
jgi:hypothetical protein